VQTSDAANKFRKYYLEFFCRAAYLAGIPMFVWDNNAKGSGDEANAYVDHATGNFAADGAEIVPLMIKACTSTDEGYWFDTIWNKSPILEAAE
jgi:endoglucanase